MKIFVERIIIKNRAPFESLDLTFNENEIAVLTAVNGRGKTTILSYIVDAWYEIARPHFRNEFEGNENKYYRISTPLYNLDRSKPSFVYIRFKTDEGNIDYVDVRDECTEQQYNEAIQFIEKIPYSSFMQTVKNQGNMKIVQEVDLKNSPVLFKSFEKKKAENVFKDNVITYFPAYRYEMPGYLNEPYKIHLDFTNKLGFSGYLPNPIEVVIGLPQLANWIMDVVLDMDLYKQTQSITLPNGEQQIIDLTPERTVLWQSLNTIINQTLISKKHQGKVRFGIGKRNTGGSRISIMNDKTVDGKLVSEQLYPTIFNLSSGEAAMLCMFGEILRQADKNRNNIALQQITGLILIDEVDKHLHIKLQNEVLPQLFNLFPKVQFIVSSHSPFLNMGLAEKSKERTKIIDLDNMGISTDPTANELFKEVYELMLNENSRFVEKYNLLLDTIKQDTKPLIITEGKTDVKHLKKAKEVLGITDCLVDFYEIIENWGDSKLKALLEHLSKVKQTRKIIGIFDRDVPEIVSDIEKNNQPFKDYSNNVYAFCIPVPKGRESYSNISIEFFYKDEDIKKEKDGKRLYFDNEVEFRQSASNKKDRTLCKLDVLKTDDEFTKKIHDENIGNLTWIHSKEIFASLVESDEDFASDLDFSNFKFIFDRIKQIIDLPIY